MPLYHMFALPDTNTDDNTELTASHRNVRPYTIYVPTHHHFIWKEERDGIEPCKVESIELRNGSACALTCLEYDDGNDVHVLTLENQ